MAKKKKEQSSYIDQVLNGTYESNVIQNNKNAYIQKQQDIIQKSVTQRQNQAVQQDLVSRVNARANQLMANTMQTTTPVVTQNNQAEQRQKLEELKQKQGTSNTQQMKSNNNGYRTTNTQNKSLPMANNTKTKYQENKDVKKADDAQIKYDSDKIKKQEEQEKKMKSISDKNILAKGVQKVNNTLENVFQKPKELYDGYQVGDITKLTASTIGGTVSHAIGGIEQVSNFIPQAFGYGMTAINQAIGKEETAERWKKATQKQQEEREDVREKIFNVTDKNSLLGKSGNQTIEGLGQSFALGTIGEASKVAGGALTFGQGFGNSLHESYSKEDVEAWQAVLRATGSGFVSYLSENLFENMGYGESKLDKTVRKKITGQFETGLAKALARTSISATGESLEEILESLGNNVIDRVMNAVTDKVGHGTNFDTDIDWEQLIEEATIAGLSGGFGEGGKTIVDTKVQSSNIINNIEKQTGIKLTNEQKQQIKNNTLLQSEISQNLEEDVLDIINNTNLTDEERISLMRTAEKNKWNAEQVKMAIGEKKQPTTIQNNNDINNNQQITQESNKTAQNGNTEQIEQSKEILQNKFNESAKNSGIKVNDKNIQNVNELLSRRGIQGEFNSDLFTNKNTGENNTNINSVWIPVKDEQGNITGRKIVFNPESKTQKTIEQLSVHEMYHDMRAGKNDSELTKLVLDKISNVEGYNDFIEGLKETYSKVYDPNSVEFNNLIEEEAVAHYLETNLGTEQFLQELSKKENRNALQKLYDLVVESLKRFGNKIAGNEEAIYLQDLKNKFEKALNGEFNGTSNSQSKFSIQTDSNGNKYVKVDTDQDIFNGIDKKDYSKVAKMYIEDYLLGNTKLSSNDTAIIDKKGAKKYTNPGKTQYKFTEKMKLTPELKNVLKVSEKVSQKLPVKQNSKYANWEYYKFNFELNGKNFEGLINIGIDSNNNKHFYEINNIKETRILGTSLDNHTSFFLNNSIPSSSEDVNTNNKYSMQEGEKNTQNNKVQDFLEKTRVNKGTGKTIQEVRLPGTKSLPINEVAYKKVLDETKYIPEEDRKELLNFYTKEQKMTAESLKEFRETVSNFEKVYKEQSDDILKEGKNYNPEKYKKYMNETVEYDKTSLKTAKEIVPANNQGRRTKEQWLTIAKQIGTEIANKSNTEIEQIAYRTWLDERPNQKSSLNRQGQKFVDFKSTDWIDTIFKGVQEQREKFSVENESESKEDLINEFKEATDNIDNIDDTPPIEPPNNNDEDLPNTLELLVDKRTKEKNSITDVKDEFMQKFVNKGHYIDKLAKQTGNKKLTHKYDRTLSSFNEAQYSIGEKQVNIRGEVVGDSLIDIFKPVEKAKLSREFEDYLLNRHNIDRTAVGKSLYGDKVSAPQSKRIAEKYEAKYPQFKEWAEKVYNYNRNSLQDMVDSGMISQSAYDNLRSMYGDYVPTYRDILETPIFNDDNRVGNNPLGKATKSDLTILSPKEAMAEQTLAIRKAIRTNELGIELYKTLGKDSKVFDGLNFDGVAIESLQGNVIQKAQDGTNLFTIFTNGEMTQFKISDELYTAFNKDTLQSKINNSKLAKALLTPVEKLSKAQRDLLTTYSIGFALNNPIKDFQDALYNTQYSDARFVVNYTRALYEIGTKGDYYNEYVRNGGNGNTYYQYNKGLLPTKQNIAKRFLDKITTLNEVLEMAPRLAEYISTIQKGGTIEEGLYNASEITTNFKRGGDITKVANRYGANFLNASVQGLDKQIRNITGQNGIKGYARLITRTALLGIAPALLNHFLLDDDEDYQDLPDYIKDSYYLIPSNKEKGKFCRIPKGRVLATIGATARRFVELSQGEEDALDGYWSEVIGNNLAPNNPLTDNLISPILQAKNNKAWYEGEIVGKRLQKLPKAEQTDEKTDKISNFISGKVNQLPKGIKNALNVDEKTGKSESKLPVLPGLVSVGDIYNIVASPKLLNYVIDQYSGGTGDIILPKLTPFAENNILEDKFTTSSILKNNNVSLFYEALESAEIANSSEFATDTDKLTYRYLTQASKDLGELYSEKRDIQNSSISDKEKKAKTLQIQEKINNKVKETLNTLSEAKVRNGTANFNGQEYYKDSEGKWKTVEEEDIAEGLKTETYSDYKNKIQKATKKKQEEEGNKKAKLKKSEEIEVLQKSLYTDKEKDLIYSNYIQEKKDKTYTHLKWINGNDVSKIDDYLNYKTADLKADEDTKSKIKGKTVSGSKKKKVVDYINGSDFSDFERLYLYGKTYALKSSEKKIFDEFMNKSDLTAEQKKEVYLDMKSVVELKDGSIKWK